MRNVIPEVPQELKEKLGVQNYNDVGKIVQLTGKIASINKPTKFDQMSHIRSMEVLNLIQLYMVEIIPTIKNKPRVFENNEFIKKLLGENSIDDIREDDLKIILSTAYSTLYNRFESFKESSLEALNNETPKNLQSTELLSRWITKRCEKEGYVLQGDLSKYPFIHRLKLVNEAFKHNDGFPRKNNDEFGFKKKQRIEISEADFFTDAINLSEFMRLYSELLKLFYVYRFLKMRVNEFPNLTKYETAKKTKEVIDKLISKLMKFEARKFFIDK